MMMPAQGAGRRRFRGEAARWGWLETSHDVAVVPTTACEETMLALNCNWSLLSGHVVFFFARLWFRVFHCGPFMGAYGGKSRNRDHNFTKGNLCKFCCLRRGVGWWGRPQPALRFAIDIAFVTS